VACRAATRQLAGGVQHGRAADFLRQHLLHRVPARAASGRSVCAQRERDDTRLGLCLDAARSAPQRPGRRRWREGAGGRALQRLRLREGDQLLGHRLARCVGQRTARDIRLSESADEEGGARSAAAAAAAREPQTQLRQLRACSTSMAPPAAAAARRAWLRVSGVRCVGTKAMNEGAFLFCVAARQSRRTHRAAPRAPARRGGDRRARHAAPARAPARRRAGGARTASRRRRRRAAAAARARTARRTRTAR
jgi:hypothetical protein